MVFPWSWVLACHPSFVTLHLSGIHVCWGCSLLLLKPFCCSSSLSDTLVCAPWQVHGRCVHQKASAWLFFCVTDGNSYWKFDHEWWYFDQAGQWAYTLTKHFSTNVAGLLCLGVSRHLCGLEWPHSSQAATLFQVILHHFTSGLYFFT